MNVDLDRHTAATDRGRSGPGMITDKHLVDLRWRLRWQSPEADHLEEYFGRMNVWRDADLLPALLGSQLLGLSPQDRFSAVFTPGTLIPPYDADRIYAFPVQTFSGGKSIPRRGRFYPQHLLPGYGGNVSPFRCLDVTGSQLTANFNHPLAGKELRVDLEVLDVLKKRSDSGGECMDWLHLLTWGPGMQARWQGAPTDFFSGDPFLRSDDRPDPVFYTQPRLVSHLDSQARQTVAEIYGSLLKPGMEVLDLMSSWQSHLPEGLQLKRLLGLGLNQEELAANLRLTESLIHDLNRDPRLPLPDHSLDAVMCTVSVEYLIHPALVFGEVARVLRPGGVFVLTFSNRWFPPKVVRIWTELNDYERLGLVLEYFLASGNYRDLMTFSSRGWPRPEDDRYFPQVRFADPVFAAWGRRA